MFCRAALALCCKSSADIGARKETRFDCRARDPFVQWEDGARVKDGALLCAASGGDGRAEGFRALKNEADSEIDSIALGEGVLRRGFVEDGSRCMGLLGGGYELWRARVGMLC